MTVDFGAIRAALAVFVEPGAVVELRVLNTARDGTVSGYYTDRDALAHAAASWSGRAAGVYITLNRCHPDLLARAVNHVVSRARVTTKDDEIVARVRLLLDFDPSRKPGMSATDAEVAAALARRDAAVAWLRGAGG